MCGLKGYLWFAISHDLSLSLCAVCEVVPVFVTMYCESLQGVSACIDAKTYSSSQF